MSRTTIKNILTNLATFLILFNMLSFVMFLYHGELIPIQRLLILPFFVMQFVRTKYRNVYVFIILHMLLAVGTAFILGDSYDFGFILAFMVMTSLYSFIVRSAGERALDVGIGGWAMALYILLFILVGMFTANPDIIRQQLVGSSLITLSLIIVHIHMDNIDASIKFVNYMDNRTHRADKILSVNNTLIIVFTALVFCVGLVTAIFPLGRIIARVFRAIFGQFGNGNRPLGNMIPLQEPPPAEEFSIPEHEIYDIELYEEIRYVPDVDYDAHWHGMVYHVFFVLISLLALGTIYGLIMSISKFIRRRKAKQRKDVGNDDTILLERNILSDIRDLLPRLGRYSKNAIRRAYAKKVNWHIRRGTVIRRSDTTDTIADKIRGTEDIDELTAMYEKVRYFK